MKVNGLRADDLAGTGLVTRQRWAVPIWASLLGLLVAAAARVALTGAVWAVRYWRTSIPAGLLAVTWWEYGWPAALTVVVVTLVGLWVWSFYWPTSFTVVVVWRVRGWWRWQTRYRPGWYPAMDGTGLTKTTPERAVYVPRVVSVLSTPVVDTLTVRLLHGHTPLDLSKAAEGLRHVYGAHRCVVNQAAPGWVRLRFYSRDPLTRTLPPIAPASVPDLRGLPVGLAEDGETFRLRVHGTHVLITGATGAGKGSALWSTIAALAPAIAAGTVRVRGCDPKGGMELYPGRALFTCYADEDASEIAALLEQAVTDLHARKRRLKAEGLRAFVPSTVDPFEVVVVDELAFLTAYATKDIKARVTTALQVLLSQGRAVGFCVLACLQDPRKDVLPFRDLFPTRIALRLAEDAHVDMVLGDGALERGARCHEIPESLPGVGYLRIEGTAEPVRVRFTYLTDTDIRALAATYPAPPVTATARVIDLTAHQPAGGPVPAPRQADEHRADGIEGSN